MAPAAGEDEHWRTVLGPSIASVISRELGDYEIDLVDKYLDGKDLDARTSKLARQLNLLNTGIQVRRRVTKKKGVAVWAEYRAIFDTGLIVL